MLSGIRADGSVLHNLEEKLNFEMTSLDYFVIPFISIVNKFLTSSTSVY